MTSIRPVTWDLGKATPCVLLVSLYPTHPPKGGRMIRLLQLAKAMRQIGYRPILLYQDFADGDLGAMRAFWGTDFHYLPYRANDPKWRVKRLVRNVLKPGSAPYRMLIRLQFALRNWRGAEDHQEFRIRLDDLYDDLLSPKIKELCEQERPCALVCLEVFMTKAFDMAPRSVRRIIDTNDIYAVGRENGERNDVKLWVDLGLEDELKGYRRADLVWAIQQKDEERIRGAASDVHVSTVGHLIDLAPPDVEATLGSKNILLVASKHKWNVQGLRWFAKEVYPLLRDFLAEKNVVIAGDIAEVLQAELPFRFLGRFPDLAAVYGEARVVFSPILGGAGLKIKNIEPMGHGKPVVSTRAAALGLEAAENRAFLVGHNAASFADAIRRLMQDDALCRQLIEGAAAFARTWNQQVLTALRDSFQLKGDVVREVPIATN